MHPAPSSAKPCLKAGCCGALAAALLALASPARSAEEPGLDDARHAPPATAVGLDALRLLQAERRADRNPPRILPLLTTRSREGRVWLGLSRDRREGDESRGVKLELVWTVPIGR